MKQAWGILKYILLAAVAVFILSAATVIFFSFYRPPLHKADAIIVLGAAINTPALYNRSIEGLELYQQGKGNVLILSGGKISASDISEAQYMQKVIAENSSGTEVSEILDQGSQDTYENIKDSKALDPKAKSVIIVSDGFHLARGSLLAMREGFWPVYWAAPPPIAYRKGQLVFYYFRESVALIDYIPKFIMG